MSLLPLATSLLQPFLLKNISLCLIALLIASSAVKAIVLSVLIRSAQNAVAIRAFRYISGAISEYLRIMALPFRSGTNVRKRLNRYHNPGFSPYALFAYPCLSHPPLLFNVCALEGSGFRPAAGYRSPRYMVLFIKYPVINDKHRLNSMRKPENGLAAVI